MRRGAEMKKIAAGILALSSVTLLAACGDNDENLDGTYRPEEESGSLRTELSINGDRFNLEVSNIGGLNGTGGYSGSVNRDEHTITIEDANDTSTGTFLDAFAGNSSSDMDRLIGESYGYDFDGKDTITFDEKWGETFIRVK